jgi:hypothetical protein
MKRILALIGLALFLVPVAPAQERPASLRQITTKDQTKEFTEEFLGAFVSSRPFDAYARLRAIAPPESEADIEASRLATEQLLDDVRPSYGRVIGMELIDTKMLGTSFVRYDYLLKFERNALHCRAVYYRPGNVWLPVQLYFNSNLGSLFDPPAVAR